MKNETIDKIVDIAETILMYSKRGINNKLKNKTTQKNLFLEKLGLKREEYGTNFSYGLPEKRSILWKRERELFGFDNRETWNLNTNFIEWLYSRLMMFNKVNIIDTTFYKVEWEGKEITQQQAIDLLIKACAEYLRDSDNSEKFQAVCDLMPLWGKVLPYMWW